jgi:hypothetical protein
MIIHRKTNNTLKHSNTKIYFRGRQDCCGMDEGIVGRVLANEQATIQPTNAMCAVQGNASRCMHVLAIHLHRSPTRNV